MSGLNFCKKYILIFAGVYVFGIVALPLFNYTIDQFRVLHGDYAKAYKLAKENPDMPKLLEKDSTFLLVKYYAENIHDFSSFILGSSRSCAIDSAKLDKGWARVNFSGGTASRYRTMLEVMENSGAKLDEVVIGLDVYSFYMDLFKNNLRNLPYTGSRLKNFITYLRFLYKLPSKYDYHIIRGDYKLSEVQYITYVHYAYIADEKRLATERYRKRAEWLTDEIRKEDYSKYTDRYGTLMLGSTMKDLTAIKEICERNGWKLVFYLNPDNYKLFLMLNPEQTEEYLTRLAELQPFYSFIGISSMNNDMRYFFDQNHFYSVVANRILDIVLRGKEVSVDSFGLRITKENVREQMKQIIKNSFKYVPDIMFNDSNLTISNNYFDNKLTMPVTISKNTNDDYKLDYAGAEGQSQKYLRLTLTAETGTEFVIKSPDGNIYGNKSEYRAKMEKSEQIFFVPVSRDRLGLEFNKPGAVVKEASLLTSKYTSE